MGEPERLDEDTTALLLESAHDQPLSAARVGELLEVDLAAARGILRVMVDDALLVRTNQERGTRYVLPGWSEHAVPTGAGGGARSLVVSPRQRDQVLRAVAHRPMTNAKVRALLGVPAATATEVLAALVHEGRLVRKGQRRGTYYVLTRTAESVPVEDGWTVSARPGTDEEPAPVGQWDRALGAAFERAVRRACDRAATELGYVPRDVQRFVDEIGAVSTAKRMLRPGGATRSFAASQDRARLDLTVEGMALQPRFAQLFSGQELSVAKRRVDGEEDQWRRGSCSPRRRRGSRSRRSSCSSRGQAPQS